MSKSIRAVTRHRNEGRQPPWRRWPRGTPCKDDSGSGTRRTCWLDTNHLLLLSSPPMGARSQYAWRMIPTSSPYWESGRKEGVGRRTEGEEERRAKASWCARARARAGVRARGSLDIVRPTALCLRLLLTPQLKFFWLVIGLCDARSCWEGFLSQLKWPDSDLRDKNNFWEK